MKLPKNLEWVHPSLEQPRFIDENTRGLADRSQKFPRAYGASDIDRVRRFLRLRGPAGGGEEKSQSSSQGKKDEAGHQRERHPALLVALVRIRIRVLDSKAEQGFGE